MEGDDEIVLSGSYKGLNLGFRFDLTSAQPDDVLCVFGYINSKIEQAAYEFAPVETKKITSFASVSGSGISAISNFFNSYSSTEIRKTLLNSVPKPELVPAAESFLLNYLFKRANVTYSVFSSSSSLSPTPEKNEDFIGFVGKYKSWIAIKKLSLAEAQEYEISAILAGINYTIMNKSFDFANIGSGESIASLVTGRKRKSYSALCEALKELEPKIRGREKESQSIFAIFKMLEKLNFVPYASPLMLVDAYPDIKPPKTRGRKPKG